MKIIFNILLVANVMAFAYYLSRDSFVAVILTAIAASSGLTIVFALLWWREGNKLSDLLFKLTHEPDPNKAVKCIQDAFDCKHKYLALRREIENQEKLEQEEQEISITEEHDPSSGNISRSKKPSKEDVIIL